MAIVYHNLFVCCSYSCSCSMPTQTVNFDRGQYQYILATSGEGEFSERVRELLDKGINVEEEDDA